jgi:hypothetical protein
MYVLYIWHPANAFVSLCSCSTYFDYLSNTFVDHCASLPARLKAADETPRPLDRERYYDEYDSNQSNTCARMAVEFYNQQEVRPTRTLDFS